MKRKLALQELLVVAVAVAALCVSGPATAHVGPLEGITPFLDEGGTMLVGASTTWGIVIDEGDVSLRVCDEAARTQTRFHHRTGDGRILIGSSDGLLVTSDEGCSYQPGDALFEGAVVNVLAVPAEEPGLLFVGTSSSSGENGVYRSDDDGLTFVATGLTSDDEMFTSLVVSPDGQSVYAGAVVRSTLAPAIHVSLDGGETWTSSAALPANTRLARFLDIDPSDGRPVLVVSGSVAGSSLVEATEDLSSVETLATFDDIATHHGTVAGYRFVLLHTGELMRRPLDGSEGPFVSVGCGPRRCLRRVAGDERLWGCASAAEQGAHFFATGDGLSWQPQLLSDDVAERNCEEGTAGDAYCATTTPAMPDVTAAECYLSPDAGAETDAGVQGDGGPRDASEAPDGAGAPDSGGAAPFDAGPAGDGGGVTPTECSCAATSTNPATAAALCGLFVVVAAASRARRRKECPSGVPPDREI